MLKIVKINVLLLMLLLVFSGCINEIRQSGVNRSDFGEVTLDSVTYRIHATDGVFTPNQPLQFKFLIINESDKIKRYPLRKDRFLYIYFKNIDNQVIHSERLTGANLKLPNEIIVEPNSTFTLPFTVTIDGEKVINLDKLYCQIQLTLLSKGLDYNRISFYLNKK